MRWFLVPALVLGWSASALLAAPPEPRDGDAASPFLSRLWSRILEELEAASKARQPPLHPPVPVTVRWRGERLGLLPLGAELLALESDDLDGDGRAELIALTQGEVVLLAAAAPGRLEIRARAALPAEPAPIRPRQAIGALAIMSHPVHRREIHARSSARARGGVYVWSEPSLTQIATAAQYRVCREASASLAPGRNYFAPMFRPPGDGPAPGGDSGEFYRAECRYDLRDAAGRQMSATAWSTLDHAVVVVAETQCRWRDADCLEHPVTQWRIPGAGVAFEVTDLNSDGFPEVITSAPVPRGEPDRVTVYTLRRDAYAEQYAKDFAGSVVALTAADLNGDGAVEAVAAIAVPGGAQVELWTLN